ncbi:hypothetical protein GVX55_10845, partial [Neisseria meningitidis]
MTYRELVERQLAVRHADLELGLSRAREQEPFVIHVSDLLDKAGIEYAVRMDKDFQTTLDSDFKCNTSVLVVGTDSRIKHLAFRSQVFFLV